MNGVLAVREGAMKRGPTPTDTFFDEVDLAPHLKHGKNTAQDWVLVMQAQNTAKTELPENK